MSSKSAPTVHLLMKATGPRGLSACRHTVALAGSTPSSPPHSPPFGPPAKTAHAAVEGRAAAARLDVCEVDVAGRVDDVDAVADALVTGRSARPEAVGAAEVMVRPRS